MPRSIPALVISDDAVLSLSPGARLVWVALWCNRDAAGLVRGITPAGYRPFCGGEETTDEDVRAWIEEVAATMPVVLSGSTAWLTQSALYPEGRSNHWNKSITTSVSVLRDPVIRNAWLEYHRLIYPDVIEAVPALEEPVGRPAFEAQLPRVISLNDPMLEADVRAVWSEYERLHQPSKLTRYRRDKILERLSDRYTHPDTGEVRVATVADLVTGLQGYKATRGICAAPETNIWMTTQQCERWVRAGEAEAHRRAIPIHRAASIRRSKKAAAPAPVAVQAWEGYAGAYRERYSVDPVRNAKANSILTRFVQRVPTDEAPQIAAFYVQHNGRLYQSAGHALDLLLRDAEKLRMEYVSGRLVEPHGGGRTAGNAAELENFLGRGGT